MRIIMANCCRSDSGTEREPPLGVLGFVIGEASRLTLPRFRLLGVLLSTWQQTVIISPNHKNRTKKSQDIELCIV